MRGVSGRTEEKKAFCGGGAELFVSSAVWAPPQKVTDTNPARRLVPGWVGHTADGSTFTLDADPRKREGQRISRPRQQTTLLCSAVPCSAVRRRDLEECARLVHNLSTDWPPFTLPLKPRTPEANIRPKPLRHSRRGHPPSLGHRTSCIPSSFGLAIELPASRQNPAPALHLMTWHAQLPVLTYRLRNLICLLLCFGLPYCLWLTIVTCVCPVSYAL